MHCPYQVKKKKREYYRVILISNIHKYETVFFIIDFFSYRSGKDFVCAGFFALFWASRLKTFTESC